jgi:hypothetical protein
MLPSVSETRVYGVENDVVLQVPKYNLFEFDLSLHNDYERDYARF